MNPENQSLEIVVSPGAGFAGAGDVAVTKAREAFDALGELLTDAIEPFRQKIRSTADSADEVEIRLDLSLKGEGKWVVVSMGGTATVSVTLLWKKRT